MTATPRTANFSRTSRATIASAFAAAILLGIFAADVNAQSGRHARLSSDLVQRLGSGDAHATSVIVTGSQPQIDRIAARNGLTVRKRLQTGAVLDVPAGRLAALAADAEADQVSGNLVVQAHDDITNQTIGADVVQAGNWTANGSGLTGQGIGVAVIDSGVANMPELRGRIIVSRDFTDDRGAGLDLNGHGTHVAGIIAAAGATRYTNATGVAPGANIISLKVLDAQGKGVMGDVIDAIDWAVANRVRYNIRVINLSLGGPVTQSYRDDPLCQAVERAYRAGVVVVASAGNHGKHPQTGQKIYGSITSPGNSPFAITVGALNTKGTPYRSDDEVASYSSKGPTLVDGLTKPDLVAPGNKILSLAAPGSTLVREHPELVIGSGRDARLQLSGTSMAAAVVAGAVADLVQAGVGGAESFRRILQYTSNRLEVTPLASGSGVLNLSLAVTALLTPSDVVGLITREGIAPARIVYCTSETCGQAASDCA